MVMDGIIKPSVANGGAAVVVDDDLGDGMQCTDHPYRNNTPGGICAFCLQEKLGKLVSTSSTFFIGSSSSSSPSFRSDITGGTTTSKSVTGFGGGVNAKTATTTVGAPSSTTAAANSSNALALSLSIRPAVAAATSSVQENDGYDSRRARIPFLLTQKKKKKLISSSSTTDNNYHHHHRPTNNLILKRSKSTATPRRAHSHGSDGEDYSSHSKRSFWSFLHLSSKHSSTTAARRSDKITPRDLKSNSSLPKNTSTISVAASDDASTPTAATPPSSVSAAAGPVSLAAKRVECAVVDETDSPNSSSSNTTSFGRKVSRSRSVGCGSRSFSGDFFERISTGFGDCTLRRVESQREGKRSSSVGSGRGGGRDAIEERVRCGGIFSGFMLTSSSSSYWVSGSEDPANGKGNGGGVGLGSGGGRPLVHGRSKSSGWSFASPMRAFGSSSRPPAAKSNGGSTGGGGGGNKTASTTPNLAAIPSLLAVR